MTHELEITNLLQLPDWEKLAEQIRVELYEPNFPLQDEQLGWDYLVNRLPQVEALKAGQSPLSFLFVAGDHLHDPGKCHLGGMFLVEYYPKSHCGLGAYMAIGRDSRGRGTARKLMDFGTNFLRKHARSCGAVLRGMFGEVRDPYSNQGNDTFDPFRRLAIWSRLGAQKSPSIM